MLVGERLPELGADLVAALAGLQCNNLAHLCVIFGWSGRGEEGRESREKAWRWGEVEKKTREFFVKRDRIFFFHFLLD